MLNPDSGLSFGLLPEHQINARAFAVSYSAITVLIILLINLGLLYPQKIEMVNYHISSWIAVALKPEPSEVPRKQRVPHTLPLIPAAPLDKAKLMVPREVRVLHEPSPEVAPPKVTTTPQFMPSVLKSASGARPDLVVHTGAFGSSATATVNAPVSKVQTGGFGDPNGIAGQGKPNGHLTMANIGSFDLPPGSGKGNGTGGTKGIAGTVASAGFGNGIASPGQGDGRASGRGSVQTAGFAAQETAPSGMAHPQRRLDSGPATTPVEIIDKPKPVYTEEARQLKLEGEVLLEVMFAANGHLHVNRVVRGMGHGLDEAAVAAADKIKFKPAMRDGQAVDSTATVHVVFQLAY